MKNLLIALLLVISINVLAQSFEGTMVWSMKMEITDPAKKAQMEDAQKMMQDPEKIKEMEKQMADPKMQEMMAQNPQMKAQMEKMLEMMKSGGGNLMPTGMTVKFKNGSSLSRLDGSFIDSDFLYSKEKNQTYMIDRKNKTYSVTKHADTLSLKATEAKVTKTSETTKILNYTCTKYLVEYTLNGKAIAQNVWATKEIKGLDLSAMANQQMGGNSRMAFLKQIDGVPLRVEMNMPDGTMLMEAKQIKRESVPASDFIIPSDYKEVKSAF
ncbi:MAG TPA: DUF4412 domain-containing protein [Cyclobacteriaceae bacterium]|nr:DUF4412 domain-containing protein [Cyclobacteriaceae bacterium]